LLRDQRGGCNHRGVLLSLVYLTVRCLFGLPAVLIRADLSKDVELLVLRHENQVLRRQLGGPAAVGSHRSALACGVVAIDSPPPVGRSVSGHPATILRWHRNLVARKWTFATDGARDALALADRSRH
jgi:hypothetical protein